MQTSVFFNEMASVMAVTFLHFGTLGTPFVKVRSLLSCLSQRRLFGYHDRMTEMWPWRCYLRYRERKHAITKMATYTNRKMNLRYEFHEVDEKYPHEEYVERSSRKNRCDPMNKSTEKTAQHTNL